jgi:hypothetical protein
VPGSAMIFSITVPAGPDACCRRAPFCRICKRLLESFR